MPIEEDFVFALAVALLRLKPSPITNGTFNAVKKTGSVVVFRLRGHFAARDTAKVGLILRAACDGLGGSFTLALSSAG